ncbi:LD-carboxypeptidase [Candidatus Omnitrophota bacterium]
MHNSKIIKPPRLKKGDTIGIVAPAWSFDPDNFKKGVNEFKRMGFKVRYDRSVFSKYWSMAGYDRERAEQINEMFFDKDIKAIFCAKGGYGSIRTIPYLDKDLISKNPKIFVGYSDITILLSYIYRLARVVVFHGPVVSGEIHRDMDDLSRAYLLRALTQPYPLGEIKFSGLKSLRPGRASGILVGGNLSLIICAVGTPYEIDTDGKILFLEDVGEDLETIDKYLMHLKLANKFKKIKGIIFGRMDDCIDHSGKKYTMKEIMKDILGDLKIPIVYGFPSGHRLSGALNVTLPMGVSVTVDANSPKIIINEAGVRL